MIRLVGIGLIAMAAFAGDLYELNGQLTPASQASVSLYGATTPFTASTLTSENGRFRFRDLLPGAYTVAVFQPSQGEARRTIEIGPGTADARRRVTLDLRFQDSDFVAPAAARQHTVPLKQLAVPEKARRDYDAAQKDLGRRDTAAAVKRLESAVEIAPQFSAAWNTLGTIAYQTQKFERAEECFRAALEADPGSYEPLVNLGGVLINLHKPGEAYTYNLHAVLVRPSDALANSQMGMTYFELGKPDLAEKYFVAARKLDPAHFSHPQLFLAEIHLRRGDKQAAAADLEDFLQYHPDWPQAAKMRETIREWKPGGN